MSALLRKTSITFAPVSVNVGRYGFQEYIRTPNVPISTHQSEKLIYANILTIERVIVLPRK
jgi:hypothetical protein